MSMMRAARVTQETSRSLGESYAQGFRKLGAAIGQGGELLDNYVTQRDIGNAAVQHTALAAQAATDLPKVLASSADPVQAVKDYWMNTYQPAVDKINAGMSTKRSRMWSAEHTESGMQAFIHSGMSQALSIVGARNIQNFQQSVDNLDATVRKDPHSYENVIKQADSLIDGMKGTLSGEQQVSMEMHRANVRQQLAVAAGHALADQNAGQFKKDLANGWGSDYLGPQAREAMGHYADYVIKKQDAAAKRLSVSTGAEWAGGKLIHN